MKFDLTQDELIVDKPISRDVHHPYKDAESSEAKILCYSVNEILAEKSRALYERQGRARDVYDVIHISRAFRETVDRSVAKHVLDEKFRFKSLPYPNSGMIIDRIDEGILMANWKNQLGHQLPVLPDVDQFIRDLPEALGWWIDEFWVEAPLPVINGKPEDRIVPRNNFPFTGIQGPSGTGRHVVFSGNILFEQIVFAARNHLCLHVVYHEAIRTVEPYSFRYPRTGNILLYVHELTRNNISTDRTKAYNLNEIRDISVTTQPFQPRYRVEL